MRHHPCLSCVLPDCDERSKGCGLRAAIRAAMEKKAAGLVLSEAEAVAWAEVHVRSDVISSSRAKARNRASREARRGSRKVAPDAQETAHA